MSARAKAVKCACGRGVVTSIALGKCEACLYEAQLGPAARARQEHAANEERARRKREIPKARS